MRRQAAALLALSLLLPAVVQAHLVNTGLGPFYDGVSHFALTPDDVIPTLALALLAGLRGRRVGRLALFALPGAWMVGGLAGLAWPSIGESATFAAGTFLLLGALVAADAKLMPRMVVALAVGLGLVNGYLNGSAMAQARLGALGLTGIVVSLFVLFALVAAMVASLRAAWARVAVRVAGSWIVAIGLLLLGWNLRPTIEKPRKQSLVETTDEGRKIAFNGACRWPADNYVKGGCS